MPKIATGLDILRETYSPKLKGRRIGLLCNQASLDCRFIPAKEVIRYCLPGHLKAVFGPQHGYGGLEQDNMIETGHAQDPELQIPVFSLYAAMREPTPEMLGLIDILIIDLQDVGTRVYTFAASMLNCLQAAAKARVSVLILDRPNPLGGARVEGNRLAPELYSFVGPFSLPMRHGLTMAELARLFQKVFNLDLDLDILPMQGWQRSMLWHETGLRWLMPSPNMPLPETAYVYPGQVIWEGTNLSEGRGTCRPFEIFGAPFLNPQKIRTVLDPEASAGCSLQEFSFRPTFNKWADEICRGFMIHVTDYSLFQPYFLSLSLLKAVLETAPAHFKWKEPPYEYEFEKQPIDLILGDSGLRKKLEKQADLREIRAQWQIQEKEYLAWRRSFLLYQ
ncbi:MAG: DUF1343 domain-containing protein [Desulfobacteraceae bacterium]|nr:MAG: DUF1343 domain-containing protein [Desulfobacteraceae bacterium]